MGSWNFTPPERPRAGRPSWAERWTFLQALVLLPLTALGLRWLGLRRWQALLLGRRPAGGPSDHALAERTARLVAAAGRLGLWRGSYLERSLVLCCLLSRRGLPAELRIGVRVEAGRLAAHAWVEAGGLVVNDHQGERRCFVPFDRPITPHPEAP
jgi:hypothetical protein